MPFDVRKPLTVAVVGLSLVACGGGGGGSSSDSPSTPVDPGTFSISGAIQIPSGTLVDLDTADPDDGAANAHNNGFQAAQTILNPAVVGGYISAFPGNYGLSSEFVHPVDNLDVYRATLLQGQTIRVDVFDADIRYRELADGSVEAINPDQRFPVVTLRLYSVDNTSTVVVPAVTANSVGQTSASATVTVPANGDYYVRLDESAGPTTYILTVGQSSAQSQQPTVADEFVPGEAIVVWEPGYQAQTHRSVAPGVVPVSGDPASGQLVRFGLGNLRTSARAVSGGTEPLSLLEQKRNTLAVIEDLKDQPGVVSVEPNYIRRAFLTPTDPLFNLQWHYSLINLPQAWDLDTNRGNGVIVAVLDTGVLPNHPDLAGQLVAGYDFVSSLSSSLDSNGLDSDPTDPGDSPVGKSSYHGTHVTGTVVAQANNSAGGVGVAFGAKVMPLRVLGNDGQGTDADIAQAIRYAAGLPNASGRVPDRKADVINLSLGSAAASTVLREAVNAARNAGVILVAAAGNDGSSQPNYPAAYDGVVSVSAVGSDKRIAPYSNFGATIDVAAPGGNFRLDLERNGQPDGIVSTWGDDEAGKPARHTYSMMEGTSMATPHVAGVAALMKAIKPDLTPAQFDELLAQGSLTQTAGDPVYYGKGLIDASKAVRKAANTELQPILAATPSAVTFDSLETSLDITFVNGGEGNLNLLSAQASTSTGSGWLSVQPSAVDEHGLGTYRVTIDRSGLNANLTYAGNIVVDSDVNDLSIPVLVQPVDAQRIANAGRHYLLLVDPALPEGEDVVAQVDLDASSGAYTYSVDQVQPGTYLLIAGSDIDNDGLICDPGEACGIYPVRNLPQDVIVTDSNLTGYNFNTGFLNDVGIQSVQSKQQRSYARLPTQRN